MENSSDNIVICISMYSYLNTITILSCHIDIYEFMKNNETIRKYNCIILCNSSKICIFPTIYWYLSIELLNDTFNRNHSISQIEDGTVKVSKDCIFCIALYELWSSKRIHNMFRMWCPQYGDPEAEAELVIHNLPSVNLTFEWRWGGASEPRWEWALNPGSQRTCQSLSQ